MYFNFQCTKHAKIQSNIQAYTNEFQAALHVILWIIFRHRQTESQRQNDRVNLVK